MCRLFTSILAAAAIVSGSAAFAQGQPASWRYSIPDGISIASYPGIVQANIQGTLNLDNYLSAAQLKAAASCDHSADMTAAIQAAVTDAGDQKTALRIPGGCYDISSQINVLKTTAINCDTGTATIFLNTANQNGIVVGDGTDAVKGLTYKTSIRGCVFNPGPSVGTSTSGSAIFMNNASYWDIDQIDVYGSNGTRRLYRGVTVYKAEEWAIRNSYFRQTAGDGVYTYGDAGVANRAVDGRIDWSSCVGISGDCVNMGPNSVGITVNSLIAYAYDGWAIRYNGGTPGPNAQNIFIFQPDLEASATSQGGIYHQTGSNVQVVGGWIGTSASGTPAVKSDAATDGLALIGLRVDGVAGYDLAGQAGEIIGGELNGTSSPGVDGLTIRATATDMNIVGTRIRQWARYGINFIGSPARNNVSGVIFKNITTAEINGQSFSASSLPPTITGTQSDMDVIIAAAATTNIRNGRNFYQIAGATPIANMTALGQNVRITTQAGAGGITFTTGGNLVFTGASVAVPAFASVSWYCDGNQWFLDGKSF